LLICIAGLLLTLNMCGGGSSSNKGGPNASLTASPNTIPKGQSSTLTWQTSNATSVTIQGIGSVPASGSQQVTPTTSTTYQLTATGPGGTTQVLAQVIITATPIQHVVIIFQENRSVDNLFHDPVLIAKGANIASSGLNSKGAIIPLTPVSMSAPYNPDHSRIPAFRDMCDINATTGNCQMDGADKIQIICAPGDPNCYPPNPQFKYVQASDAMPYFQMAETYTFGDNMFQTNQGPSFPAHQFIISGTSAPSAGSNLFAAENPSGEQKNSGCTAPPDQTVQLITPTGDESQTVYPCFDHPTLTDELNSKGISWRYYTPSAGTIWTSPNAIQHMCGPNATPPNATACTGSDWTNNVVLQNSPGDVHKPNAVLADISAGKLATVSWVIPSGEASDHPATTDGSGPSWVAQIVNAIGNSPYWADTAIIITWDDWGGWYDHVPPPAILNAYEFGFRVPLVVVSPYAKPQYISHKTFDFGSIMKFIELNFGLSTVAAGYADTFTQTGDLTDCFNFSQQPLTFQTITAPGPEQFPQAKGPPADPDDD
jgi:phospholipase C